MEELRRQAGWAKTFGLPMEMVSADEAKEKFPLMSTDGVLGAAWIPTDGYLDPAQLTNALADGARRGGCSVFTNTRVTGIDVRDGRARGVSTDRGDIEAEVVVIAGGMYGAELGRLAGVRIPIIPMSHQYLVTQPFRERDPENPLPTLRDPDLLIYYREEGGGLVMGGYERQSEPAFLPDGTAGLDRIPPDFNGRLLEDDWDRFVEITENSKRRVPVMDEVTITQLINGPEGFTPDNEFCLGETEVLGLFVAAGFCAHGLAGAGGIGKVMAEWIVDGEPSVDLWEMDIRRFGAQYRSPSYTPCPDQGDLRDLLRHPLSEPRAAGGAAAADLARQRLAPRARRRLRREVRLGAGQLVRVECGRGRRVPAPAWLGGSALVAGDRRRARATREGVAIFDETSFAKMEIEGPGRGRARRAALRQQGGAGGRQAHLYADAQHARRDRVRLHRRHGSPRTASRSSPARPSATTTASGSASTSPAGRQRPGARHDLAMGVLRDLGAAGARGAAAADAPGPRQRGLPLHEPPRDHRRQRAQCGPCGSPMSASSAGSSTAQASTVPGSGGRCGRRGSLTGSSPGGYRAIDSMRLEKGYRVWGADITPDETPYEGGVGFCVKLDKEGGFIGRDALWRRRSAARKQALLPAAGGPAVGRARQRAGPDRRRDPRPRDHRRLRLHGGALDRIRLPAFREAEPGTAVAVEIFGSWVEGEVAAEPLFDPKGERLRV